MPRFGIHASIAKGFPGAVTEGENLGCKSLQIFSKTASQWKGKPIDPDSAAKFRESRKAAGIHPVAAHDSYLINIASPNDDLWLKSLEALRDELQRADFLGLEFLVMHPGSHVGSGEEAGLAKILSGLDKLAQDGVQPDTRLLFETTAGQGTNLGYKFEHLKTLLNGTPKGWNTGVCLDTCHVLAAGYGFSTKADYKKTMTEFDKVVGLVDLHFFHINDSAKPLGSRVDRHAHLGEGFLGMEALRELVNDPAFREKGMILETAKEERNGESMDAVNLRFLKGLMKGKKPTK